MIEEVDAAAERTSKRPRGPDGVAVELQRDMRAVGGSAALQLWKMLLRVQEPSEAAALSEELLELSWEKLHTGPWNEASPHAGSRYKHL